MGIVRNADKYLYQTEIEINIVVNDEWLVVNMPVVSRQSPLTTHHFNHSPLTAKNYFLFLSSCSSTSLTFRRRSEAKIKLFSRSLVAVNTSSLVPSHSLCP